MAGDRGPVLMRLRKRRVSHLLFGVRSKNVSQFPLSPALKINSLGTLPRPKMTTYSGVIRRMSCFTSIFRPGKEDSMCCLS